MHSAPRQCANGDGQALTQCTGCRAALCDRCATWEINRGHWCEACGNRVEEETRPRILAAAVVFVLGFACLALLTITGIFGIEEVAWGILAVFVLTAKAFWPTTGRLPTLRRRHSPH